MKIKTKNSGIREITSDDVVFTDGLHIFIYIHKDGCSTFCYFIRRKKETPYAAVKYE